MGMNAFLRVVSAFLCTALPAPAVSAAAIQRGPSARYCAAEAGQGRYPQSCPRPPRAGQARQAQRPSAHQQRRRQPSSAPNRYYSGGDLRRILLHNVFCEGYRNNDDHTCTAIYRYSQGRNSNEVRLTWSIRAAVSVSRGEEFRRQYSLSFAPIAVILTSYSTQTINRQNICVKDENLWHDITMVGPNGQSLDLSGQDLERARSRYVGSPSFIGRCQRWLRPSGVEPFLTRETVNASVRPETFFIFSGAGPLPTLRSN